MSERSMLHSVPAADLIPVGTPCNLLDASLFSLSHEAERIRRFYECDIIQGRTCSAHYSRLQSLRRSHLDNDIYSIKNRPMKTIHAVIVHITSTNMHGQLIGNNLVLCHNIPIFI